MADKKISELDQTLILSDQADFPLSQDNGGEPTTFRAKLTQIATKIAEAITFSNLKTGNKQLVSAVNQTISNLADDFNTTAGSTYSKDDCVLYNGVLYQCINNSGTTSGTFIAADWTEIKAVDVGSGGGGGGGAGGHTIVDDSGTSLTQRTNLQFLGAYSEDNSTDDTTEIDVVREMTKAEFDELTEAEKTGLINITDITGGNDDRFQPVIYSTEEKEIGVWKDGKPLYQKTVDCGTLPNASGIQVAHNISNLADVVCIFGYAVNSSYTSIPLPYPDTVLEYNVNVSADTTYISISTGRDRTQFTGYITIQYTKTTDTAGSGQWTPQGVPAHHYSTDEQVVGTWIDGSTVYEKTIYVPTVSIRDASGSTATQTIEANFVGNNLISASGYYRSSANGDIISIPDGRFRVIINAGNLSFEAINGGSWTGSVYITIRYTKTST